jgi:hypothetical protein
MDGPRCVWKPGFSAKTRFLKESVPNEHGFFYFTTSGRCQAG